MPPPASTNRRATTRTERPSKHAARTHSTVDRSRSASIATTVAFSTRVTLSDALASSRYRRVKTSFAQ